MKSDTVNAMSVLVGAIGLGACFAEAGSTAVAVLALTAVLRSAWLKSPLATLSAGLIAGTVAGGLSEVWVPNALRNLGTQPTQSWAAWLLLAVWVGGLPNAVLAAAVRGGRRLPPLSTCLVTSGFAFVYEHLSTVGVWTIPWLSLGYAVAPSSGMGQLASLGGAPFVSAALVAIAVGLNRALDSMAPIRPIASIVVATLALGVGGISVSEAIRRETAFGDHAESATRILAVQPSIRRGERWVPELQSHNARKLIELAARESRRLEAQPDVILMPENSLTIDPSGYPALRAALERDLESLGVSTVVGVSERKNGSQVGSTTYPNAVWLFSPEGTADDRITKAIAVPLVESPPGSSLGRVLSGLLGAASDDAHVQEQLGERTIGHEPRIAVMLCYEALFPIELARSPDQRPLLIANLADDSWTDAPAADRQLTLRAIYRGVENRLPVVRVAHGGLSVFADEYGRVRQALPPNEAGAMLLTVQQTEPATPTEHLALILLPLGTGSVVWWGWRVVGVAVRRRSGRSQEV